MGSLDGEFDAWLERSLARELGRVHKTAPSRDWTRPRPHVRRRLAAASGAGGALALKAAGGAVVVAFAVGATGTAMTGRTDPVAWGQAVGEATVAVLPVHAAPAIPAAGPGAASPEPAPAPRSSPQGPVAAVATSGRQVPASSASAGGAHGAADRHPVHHPKASPPPRPRDQGEQESSARHLGVPALASDPRHESHD